MPGLYHGFSNSPRVSSTPTAHKSSFPHRPSGKRLQNCRHRAAAHPFPVHSVSGEQHRPSAFLAVAVGLRRVVSRKILEPVACDGQAAISLAFAITRGPVHQLCSLRDMSEYSGHQFTEEITDRRIPAMAIYDHHPTKAGRMQRNDAVPGHG